MNVVLLIVSVLLGAGRSVFSKKATSTSTADKTFYIHQSVLFFSSAVAVFTFDVEIFKSITVNTLIYGVVFGLATFFAQWCYMLALNRGSASICAMIYSFGFIIPTVLGTLFWNEPFGVLSAIGLAFAIAAIITSAFSGKGSNEKGKGFIVPNLIAMFCSGALGLIQKMHQSSKDAVNLNAFLVIAFLLAAAISAVIAMFCKKNILESETKTLIFHILAGICLGAVSMFNTVLAGRLASNIVFPTLNIGVMMSCLIAGRVVFKEKITKMQIVAFLLGIVTIMIMACRNV